MKLLIVTNLFPSAVEPNRATFNFQQFSALAKLCELKVVAPVPMFRYSREQVPEREVISGIEVFHPRYLVIPKVFRFTHGLTFFLGIWHILRVIQQSFEYDVILASWAYPDAYGAALAARMLKKRLFVKVQGSDINLAHGYWGRVPMIRWALKKAEKVIAVSRPLKEKLLAMGIPDSRVVVIPNGVDKEKFHPRDKSECRKALGLGADRKMILFVGNLTEVKGVEYLIRAFEKVLSSHPEGRRPEGSPSMSAGDSSLRPSGSAQNDGNKGMPADLVIVGDGPLRNRLETLAGELGIKDRVLFKGRRPYDEVPLWLNAADVFCLPSLNEGCPNVVLEALACGTKVVASNVGGVPDIIDAPEKGWLARPKDPDHLAQCLRAALEAPVSAEIGQSMSWEDNAGQLLRTLSYEQ